MYLYLLINKTQTQLKIDWRSDYFDVQRKQIHSYTRAREIIREALSSTGINMNNYGLHSLRSGGASAAYKGACQTDRGPW
jgi:S-adenosylmethionine/arginine decarboxylase-like enzyme